MRCRRCTALDVTFSNATLSRVFFFCVLLLGRYIFVVLEFCSVGSLGSLISKRTVGVNEIAVWVAQLAMGLKEMHQLYVLHRDIKPENILVTMDGSQRVVKYTDFGLAIEIEETTSRQYGCAGTAEHMAPEVASRQPYSFPADIWSLGVIFLEVRTLEAHLRLVRYFSSRSHFFLLVHHHNCYTNCTVVQHAKTGGEFVCERSNALSRKSQKRQCRSLQSQLS